MLDLWHGAGGREMSTNKLIVVKHTDVSCKVWAVGEIDPDFLPTRVKEESAPQTHTIDICTPTHIGPTAGVQYVAAQRRSLSAALSFLSLPPPSLIWPISILAVILSPQQSQYGLRVDCTRTVYLWERLQPSLQPPSSVACAPLCILSSVCHLQLHRRSHASMCYL